MAEHLKLSLKKLRNIRKMQLLDSTDYMSSAIAKEAGE
jgi:hypothetical protein